MGPAAFGAEGLAVFGNSEEIAFLGHSDQACGDGFLVIICVAAHRQSSLWCFRRLA
jgi:hypothetical protein